MPVNGARPAALPGETGGLELGSDPLSRARLLAVTMRRANGAPFGVQGEAPVNGPSRLGAPHRTFVAKKQQILNCKGK